MFVRSSRQACGWLFACLLHVSRSVLATNPLTHYANDFPDPNAIVGQTFDTRFNGAKATIIAWAEESASYGPWSVTTKPVTAPSGDKHDYMSWAPYQWPDCSNVKNTTALSPQDMWKQCNYVFRDGQVNPDRNMIQDFQAFTNLSDAILYNAIAHTFQNQTSSKYSQNAVKIINTWFLNNDTAMNPNLNYAQMNRGPNGQMGAYTGVLDLRGFARIASGVLILRKSKSSDWTSDLDNQLIAWCSKYIGWLNTSPSGKQAAAATNNHGTFFTNQFAALKLITNDAAGAASAVQGYFKGAFQGQIKANGDQPMEASRSRPYHYRNFNIGALITNARIGTYADPNTKPWNATANGATIQTTVDFVMTVDPAATKETDVTAEIYPNVAAVAGAYGDPDGKYSKFLIASGFPYADEPTFLWSQPLAGGDTAGASGDSNNTSSDGGPSKNKTGGALSHAVSHLSLVVLMFSTALLVL